MKSILALLRTIMDMPAVDVATKLRAGFLVSRLQGHRFDLEDLKSML